jgi:high affinity sulfate transporter 1
VTSAAPAENLRSRLRAVFPPAAWLPAYERRWLRHDAIAGLTLAAYAIPVSLAYASLAGLPPQNGVYGYLAGGLAYALFGSSRQLAVGPTSAISMLVAASVGVLAAGDPARFAAIAALAALAFAALSAGAWLLRLSAITSFISETILLGFKAGAALVIAMTQLPKLFGVPGGGDHFLERAWILGGQLGDTNPAVLAFGLAAIALMLIGERLLPGRPVVLAVVALAIAALAWTPLRDLGMATVGEIPAGLPELAQPSLRVSDVDGVIPLAFACFLLAYIESVSAGRALAARHDYEIDPRQELLGLGAANLAASFAQSYPIAGGLSQSTVNDRAGAKTPLALVFASAAIAACLLFLTGLLRDLPTVVLAAIVLVAVKGLIDLPELREMWRLSRFEFAISMVAFVGVLLLGILRGVVLAAVVSGLMLIWRVARPNVASLGRVPGTRRYSDLARHADNQPIPGALLLRVEASLLYFNVESVREDVRRLVRAAGERLRLVVCDLGSSPHVDVAGARMLAGLAAELAQKQVLLRLVEARGTTRDLLRAEGLEDQVGHVSRRVSLDDVVRAFEESGTPPGPTASTDRPSPPPPDRGTASPRR